MNSEYDESNDQYLNEIGRHSDRANSAAAGHIGPAHHHGRDSEEEKGDATAEQKTKRIRAAADNAGDQRARAGDHGENTSADQRVRTHVGASILSQGGRGRSVVR